jgi:hypothetical protein
MMIAPSAKSQNIEKKTLVLSVTQSFFYMIEIISLKQFYTNDVFYWQIYSIVCKYILASFDEMCLINLNA